MILKGFMDESGDDKLFTLSCLISNGDIWANLESDWLACLSDKNHELKRAGRKTISRFHAADCSNSFDEFTGWGQNEQIEFVKALLSIFNKYPFVNHSYGVNLHEMVEEIPLAAPNPDGFAYVILFMMLMLEINDHTLEQNQGMLIRIFHDHCDYDAALLEAYNHLLEAPFIKHRHHFIGLAPERWQYCVPLQPADLMAYENFKELKRLYAPRKRRKSLNNVLTYGRLGGKACYFDREGMKAMKRMFDDMDEYTKEFLLAMARIKKAANRTS